MIFAAPPIVVVDEAPPASAHAFTRSTPEGTWSAMPIPLVPSANGPLPIASELDVATRAWRAAPCASVSFAIAAPRDVSAADDGTNVVIWETVAWPATLQTNAPAQTVLHVDGAGHFRDADIHLNAVDYAWSVDGVPGTVDLRGILTHELGHVLGLGHSSDPNATMFASTSDPASWRSLEADDIAGVCALYPGAGRAECNASDPCPSPYSCVAARCERDQDGGVAPDARDAATTSDAGTPDAGDAGALPAPALASGGGCATAARADDGNENAAASLLAAALACVTTALRRRRSAPSSAPRASCKARR